METQAKATSSSLTGGAGFTFEDGCMAIYLAALLGQQVCRGLPNRIVVRVASQQGPSGEPMDDIIVEAEGLDKRRAKLSLQVKQTLTISSADSNTDFRQIIQRAHATLKKDSFQANHDQVGAITGSLSKDPKKAFEDICAWAKSQDSVETFLKKFLPGVSNETHRTILEQVRTILKESISDEMLDVQVYQLFRHFVLMEFDLLHDGSRDESNTVTHLSRCLHPTQANRSGSLWTTLRVIARTAAGHGAVLDRSTLVAELHGSFRLAGASSLQRNLERLEEETQAGLKDITFTIAGTGVPRPKVISDIKSKLRQHKFVQVSGLPGTGKSAILRLLVEGIFSSGSGLFLKSDRLVGPTWSSYASAIGLDTVSLGSLLLEISHCGTPFLAIDGLDRIAPVNRGIVRDLFNEILGNPVLRSAWSIVVTVRDGGIEDIRTWLPPELFAESQPAIVEIKPFDDEESKALADANPALRHLLFGDEQIREIARRPFFASVIGKAIGSAQGTPVNGSSEIQLIEAWWSRGGYDADPGRILQRKETLRSLATLGATTLGRGMPTDGLDLGAITELQNDCILKESVPGRVKFSHDIFFEWAYLQVLVGCETEWPAEIRRVGEPPVLGRVVELLSQKNFISDTAWGDYLSTLEASDLRPQWVRAWMLGPVGHPEFLVKASRFTEALFLGNVGRVQRLATWFPAEKTRPNPAILDGSILKTGSLADAVRLADLYAWPSDIGSWQRACQWFIDNIARCPVEAIPDIISVFEVWQNLFADMPNAISRQIMTIVRSWLVEIEDLRHPEGDRIGYGQWHTLPEGGVSDLEERLRNLFLRSARFLHDEAKDYLLRVTARRRLRDKCFREILVFSPILAESLGTELVGLLMAEMKKELPFDDARRSRRGTFDHHDRQNFALNPNSRSFFPASPIWQPFPALFQSCSQEGLAAVRELANHAITAWRQFSALDGRRNSTPLPLILEFPWGRQKFWGNNQTYTWFRGNGGPNVVASGLMALEKWAFLELGKGRDADDLIREILSGHESCAILGIAVAIAIQAKKVSATTLPLVTSQALWWWDIARFGFDRSASGMTESFHKSGDHKTALREQNGWEIRKFEIRSLAMLFVLGRDEGLRGASQIAIQGFPQNLHFDTEEEEQAGGSADSLRRQAVIWAELGKPENYSATRLEEEKKVLIEHRNPMAQDPDVLASQERIQTLTRYLGLLQWAEESLKNQMPESMSLSKAIVEARTLEAPELFSESTEIPGMLSFNGQAVAATAAVALKYASTIPEEDRLWAEEIVLRATNVPEGSEDEFYSLTENPYHVGFHALRGLIYMVRGKIRVSETKRALIRLAAHPRQSISQAAIGAMLSLWDMDKRFAWIGFDLAISLSIGHWNGNRDDSQKRERENNAKAVEAALNALESTDSTVRPLSLIPLAWVFAPARSIQGPFGEEIQGGKPIWRDPDEYFNHRYLSALLGKLPFRELLNDAGTAVLFLDFCKSLVKWTVEKMAPSWEEQGTLRHRDNETELFEWTSELGRFLGQVALHLEPNQARDLILERVLSLEDEKACSILHPFLDMLGRCTMDEPTFPENAIELMRSCLPKILANGDWATSRTRKGRLFGDELPNIIRSLFFVQIPDGDAPNSARFANGNWSDVGKIIPIVDAVVMSVGDIPGVTSLFLSLCERVGALYPIEPFLDQMHGIFKLQAGTPVGWRGTYMPNRIASLIQNFATRAQPLALEKAQSMLRLLDRLVDMGDRRATALQTSELFKNIRVIPT
jgi:hypothetical protein